MKKAIGGVLLAVVLIFGVGGILSESFPTPTVQAKVVTEPNYSAWVYQVTEIDGNGKLVDYYGTNNQYEDFPHIYFTQEEVGKLKIKEGDWVVTIFNHDDLIKIVKLN